MTTAPTISRPASLARLPGVRDLGSREPLYVPDVADSPKSLHKAIGEWHKLTDKLTEVQVEQRRLEQHLPEAEVADRRAHAAAIRAGKPDPGTPTADRCREQITEAVRLHAATLEAVVTVHDELKVGIAASRDAWLAKLADDDAANTATIVAAVDALNAARTATVRTRQLRAWLTEFPAVRNPKFGSGVVFGLNGANGEPLSWDAVISALYGEATDRKPQRFQTVPNPSTGPDEAA